MLATWKGRHLEGLPAVTMRRVGQGAVIYAGAYLTQDLLECLLPEIEKQRSLARLWPFAPAGVQVVRRQDENKEIWFFINTTDACLTIEKTPNGLNLITNQPADGPLTLEPNQVAVIQTTREATPGI